MCLKIDTGAQGNILPVSTFCRIFPEKLDTDGFPNIKKQFINKKLIAYNGTPIKCFGNIKIPCQYNKSDWYVSIFHIVDVQGPAVLGLPSLEQLKLITFHCTVKKEDVFQTPAATRTNATKDLMQMYPDQFDKIGSMPGEVRLSVNKNIHPHNDAPRKTPIALKDYIKQELDNMVKNKIIRKETKADPVLDQLQGIITTGWPDSIKDLPPVIRSFWPYRNELSVNDGIIMKGSRIIISETQQKLSWTSYITAIKVLKKRLQARDAVYWERINADIENMTKNCSICQETFRHNQRKLYSYMTSPAEHGKSLAQICLTAIIMNI